MIALPQSILKICPACNQAFTGHPNAIYCDVTCANRAARRRRSDRRHKQRETQKAPETSPYEFTLENISAETLTGLYASTALNIYSKDIRINGPIPANVPCPSDVVLEYLNDHHVIYHKSRTIKL